MKMKNTGKNLLFAQYLVDFTDDVGIFQHSIYGVPDLRHGYTTDDNCRALIAAVLLFERFKKKKYLRLINKYLAFMLYAQNDDGKFKNFMSYQRAFVEDVGSEDCFGRCLWSLGRTFSSPVLPDNIRKSCEQMIDLALAHFPDLVSPRAKAYTIVGLSYLTEKPDVTAHIEALALSLVEQYNQYKDRDWHWFEDSMTYGNAFFPWALLRAYNLLKSDALLETANESMAFLSKMTMTKDYFKPIGCKGWLIKGQEPAQFDEQPLEACETMLAYLEYYNLTKDKKLLAAAIKCFNWYYGQNSQGLPLINLDSGACFDGLNEEGLNLNQGSESIVAYAIAYMEISKYIRI